MNMCIIKAWRGLTVEKLYMDHFFATLTALLCKSVSLIMPGKVPLDEFTPLAFCGFRTSNPEMEGAPVL